MSLRWSVGGHQVPTRTTRLEAARCGLQGASSAHYLPIRLAASPPQLVAPAFPYRRDADGCLSPFPLQSPVPPSSAHAGIEAPCTSMPCSVVFPFSIKRPCLLPPRAAPLLPWHETCSRLWPSAARAPSSSTEQPLLSIPVPRRPVPRTYHLSRYLSPTASYFVQTGPNSARLFLPVPAVLMRLARRVQICLSTLVARALCA